MTRPLRSRRITRPSSLLRVVPSLCLALVLSPSRGLRLGFSLGIEATGSKVPCSEPDPRSRRLYAGRRMDRIQAPSMLIPGQPPLPGFDVVYTISVPHQRFTCVRLRGPHLTRSRRAVYTRRFPRRLLTVAARAGLWPGSVPRPRKTSFHLEHSFSLHTVIAIFADDHVSQQPRRGEPLLNRRQWLFGGDNLWSPPNPDSTALCSHARHAYFNRTCSITVSFAGT